jgi:hypothetical protein
MLRLQSTPSLSMDVRRRKGCCACGRHGRSTRRRQGRSTDYSLPVRTSRQPRTFNPLLYTPDYCQAAQVAPSITPSLCAGPTSLGSVPLQRHARAPGTLQLPDVGRPSLSCPAPHLFGGSPIAWHTDADPSVSALPCIRLSPRGRHRPRPADQTTPAEPSSRKQPGSFQRSTQPLLVRSAGRASLRTVLDPPSYASCLICPTVSRYVSCVLPSTSQWRDLQLEVD